MFESNTHATLLVVVQVTALLVVAYLFYRAHQAKQSRQHELSRQLLDKMSSEQFLEVLQSSNGRRSIERMIGSSRSTDQWAVDAIRRAILLLGAGTALVLMYPMLDFSGDEIPLICGGLFLGTGLGYLVAAALTRARAGNRADDSAA